MEASFSGAELCEEASDGKETLGWTESQRRYEVLTIGIGLDWTGFQRMLSEV